MEKTLCVLRGEHTIYMWRSKLPGWVDRSTLQINEEKDVKAGRHFDSSRKLEVVRMMKDQMFWGGQSGISPC